jgi:hypothetical protein
MENAHEHNLFHRTSRARPSGGDGDGCFGTRVPMVAERVARHDNKPGAGSGMIPLLSRTPAEGDNDVPRRRRLIGSLATLELGESAVVPSAEREHKGGAMTIRPGRSLAFDHFRALACSILQYAFDVIESRVGDLAAVKEELPMAPRPLLCWQRACWHSARILSTPSSG